MTDRWPQTEEAIVNLQVDGEWTGWNGTTVVRLTDGTTWEQVEYCYEYHYAYKPNVSIANDRMRVEGMSKAVQVRKVR